MVLDQNTKCAVRHVMHAQLRLQVSLWVCTAEAVQPCPGATSADTLLQNSAEQSYPPLNRWFGERSAPTEPMTRRDR